MRIVKNLVYPESSYKIVGAAFNAFNEIGYGFPEKVYQRALEKEFKNLGIGFSRETYIPLLYKDENLVRYFADFLVEGKIIVELKVVPKLTYSHAKQLLSYLRSTGVKLGILLYFTREGVKYRRVINSAVESY